MRKHLTAVIVLIGLAVNSMNAQSLELNQVREIFHKPVSEKNIQEIINLPADKYNSPSIKAYQAVSKTMMAEFVFSPFSKLSYFNKGKKELETILLEHKNLETTYLRLLIQLNIPSLLSYYSNIEPDLDYFCINFESSKINVNTKMLFKETLLKTAKIGEYPEKLKELQNL